jgi:hypothetical protein
LVTVQVTVVAPDEKNMEFQGSLRVENQGNSTDSEEIPVYLKTPLQQELLFHKFFEGVFRVFPKVFSFLRLLLGFS